MSKGTFYAVGTGSGDPLDMTLKAIRTIEKSDMIVVPVKKQDGQSKAFDIVSQNIDTSGKTIKKIVFPMEKCRDYRDIIDISSFGEIFRALDCGKDVSIITLGDVSIYSTASYAAAIVQAHGYRTETVAGVPSFSSCAARAGISICENDETFAVIPAVLPIEKVKEMILANDTSVIMKAGRALEQLVPFLRENAILDKTVMFCNLGLDNEYIGSPENFAGYSYFTTLIIKKG